MLIMVYRKGNNRWRDSLLPSERLLELTAGHGLPAPRYEGAAVTVDQWTVHAEQPPPGAGGECWRETSRDFTLWHHRASPKTVL